MCSSPDARRRARPDHKRCSSARVKIDQTTSGTTNAVYPLATENHIGEVGNNEITLTTAITSTVVTYTTGQSIGGLLTIANAARVSGAAGTAGTSGLIQKAVLGSSVTNTVQVDVIYFNASPTGSTCTNASAYSLAAADRSKVIGTTHITDWEASAAAYSGQALKPRDAVCARISHFHFCLRRRQRVNSWGKHQRLHARHRRHSELIQCAGFSSHSSYS
jgi:hypothetical protein